MDYSIAKPKSLTFLESGASILWEQSQAERGRPLSTDRKSFINVTLSAPPGADRLLDRWPFSPPTGVGHNIEEFDSLGSDNDIFFASNWQSLSLTWQKSSPFRRCRSRTHAAHTSHGPPSGETFPKTCAHELAATVAVKNHAACASGQQVLSTARMHSINLSYPEWVKLSRTGQLWNPKGATVPALAESQDLTYGVNTLLPPASH